MDFLDLENDEAREKQRGQALDFAKLYLVFTEGRGKQLLEYWTATISKRRTPVNATIQEYAANTAVRDFIEGIKDQIELANSSGLRF